MPRNMDTSQRLHDKRGEMTNPIRQSLDCPNLEGTGTHRVSFFDWGDATADQVVVCVHGLTRNAHDFDSLAKQAVATGCRVLAIDMAGRGESEWLADPSLYHYATYMTDCLAILDNFHLRSVDWVGTSLGGIVGMMIAAFHPGRIRKLVLNDIGAFIPAAGLKRIMAYVSAAPSHFATEDEAKARLREVFASFGVRDDEWPHLLTHSIKPADGGGFRFNFDPAILEPLRAETHHFTQVNDVDLSELWEGIDIPTLILRGAESDLLEPETVLAMRAKNLRCSSVEFAGVGHAPTLMSDEQIHPIIQFLGGGAAGVMKRAL